MRVFNRSVRTALRRIAVVVAVSALAFTAAWLQFQYWGGTVGDEPITSVAASATAATTSAASDATPMAAATAGVADATSTAAAMAAATVAAPAQTPSPEETQAVPGQCGQAVVSGVDALAMRDAPGLGSQRIGTRPSGTVVDLLCDAPVEVDGVTWRKVRTAGVEGWMAGRFLK